MIRRALRLLYLLAQHPLHLHRGLVDRGLTLGWIRRFAPFWDTVRPPGLPITDYASYRWLEYHFSARLRAQHPTGDHFDAPDAQYARLLSYVLRRERHPLRMLRAAWWLRGCRTVLEFGAGAAPYASFITRAWPWRQQVWIADQPGVLQQYTAFAFVVPWCPVISAAAAVTDTRPPWDGLVCTEVFEHLPDPLATAQWMTRAARRLAFDYVDDGTPARTAVLAHFAATGCLLGPDQRGLYRWARR